MTLRETYSTASYVVTTKQSKMWKTIPLGDLCYIKGGGTPSKKILDYYAGEIPWVTVKDFTAPIIYDTQDHITEKAITESATNLIPSGTVLVVTRVGLGKVAITGRGMAINQDVKALFPREQLLSEYLFWFLVSKASDIEQMGVGATVKGIILSQLKGLTVPVPPVEEQRRIVDILKRVDGIRRLRNQAQDTARQLIPALFIDMFGDPVTNPKGWPVLTIGEVIESADYGSSTKASSNGTGLPLIRMGNVDYAGHLDLSDLKYVELATDEVEKFRIQAGDILFNRTNSKDLVGKTGLWDGGYEAAAASYFIRVRVKQSTINPFYLWAFMNTAHMKHVLFETARGAIGQANINARELRGFKVALPPLGLQGTFEQRCRDVESIRSQHVAATAKAKATFDVLLAQAFSVDLR